MPPPFSRDRSRSRLSAASAFALLGLVVAALLAFCPPPAPPAHAAGDHGVVGGAVLTALDQAPGCGKGSPDGDRGAQPAAPPRGAVAYEPPPAPYVTHCATWDQGRSQVVPGVLPDGRPPPPAPPSPEELSIVRV
ncbi:hypothetical protein [Streptomyces sp. NPDC048057]|uniref:hypothetical protein n=1 Tax=Streptomyces sp. NPDC048057 TaxID=3155628 RepID=UPI0033E0981F